MPFPIKKICYFWITFTADDKRLPGDTFVIKESKHINIHNELVFVEVNIIKTDWVRKGVEVISTKYLISVINGSF